MKKRRQHGQNRQNQNDRPTPGCLLCSVFDSKETLEGVLHQAKPQLASCTNVDVVVMALIYEHGEASVDVRGFDEKDLRSIFSFKPGNPGHGDALDGLLDAVRLIRSSTPGSVPYIFQCRCLRIKLGQFVKMVLPAVQGRA